MGVPLPRFLGCVVVARTDPEQCAFHVFRKAVGNGYARPITIKYRRSRACKRRESIRLKPHTDPRLGFGDTPINIAPAHLDLLSVRTEGCAIPGDTPVLVSDFKKNHALEGFRDNRFNSGAQPAGGLDGVSALPLGEIAVSPRNTVLGQALDHDVHGLRCRRGTQNKPGGEERCYKSLHVTFLD